MTIRMPQTLHLPTEAQLNRIEGALGYNFRDRNLLRRAFFHPSSGKQPQAEIIVVSKLQLLLQVTQSRSLLAVANLLSNS